MSQERARVPDAAYKISVLIPTYRRPLDLMRCLAALERQVRLPDDLVIVYRDTDVETRELLSARSFPFDFTAICVSASGVVAALNTGLDAVRGDIVAFTDDDSAPRPDWLARVEDYFVKDAAVGGVGGRDHVYGEPVRREATTVGKIGWFGRPVGDHHIGRGPARDVHVLKGVNMSFRRDAIGSVRFDERLRGAGAQVHNELAFCLAIRAKGWRLIYDPEVAVDHFPAQRFDEDQRSTKSLLATRNAAFNQTLALLLYLRPLTKAVFWLWAFAVGTRDLPGIVQCIRFSSFGNGTWHRLPAVFGGRIDALKTYRSSRSH